MVFVCTESNSVYALDGDTVSIRFWHIKLGTPYSPAIAVIYPRSSALPALRSLI